MGFMQKIFGKPEEAEIKKSPQKADAKNKTKTATSQKSVQGIRQSQNKKNNLQNKNNTNPAKGQIQQKKNPNKPKAKNQQRNNATIKNTNPQNNQKQTPVESQNSQAEVQKIAKAKEVFFKEEDKEVSTGTKQPQNNTLTHPKKPPQSAAGNRQKKSRNQSKKAKQAQRLRERQEYQRRQAALRAEHNKTITPIAEDQKMSTQPEPQVEAKLEEQNAQVVTKAVKSESTVKEKTVEVLEDKPTAPKKENNKKKLQKINNSESKKKEAVTKIELKPELDIVIPLHEPSADEVDIKKSKKQAIAEKLPKNETSKKKPKKPTIENDSNIKKETTESIAKDVAVPFHEVSSKKADDEKPKKKKQKPIAESAPDALVAKKETKPTTPKQKQQVSNKAEQPTKEVVEINEVDVSEINTHEQPDMKKSEKKPKNLSTEKDADAKKVTVKKVAKKETNKEKVVEKAKSNNTSEKKSKDSDENLKEKKPKKKSSDKSSSNKKSKKTGTNKKIDKKSPSKDSKKKAKKSKPKEIIIEPDPSIEPTFPNDYPVMNNHRVQSFRESNIKVELSYVTKKHDVYEKRSDRLRDFLLMKKSEISQFWSLKGVSFQVKAGESVGIIGVNGSGKSTLANIIAGALKPTTGEVRVNGEVSIISISSGLKGELTGLENIKFKLLMSGYSDKEIEDLLEDIISFSELGKQINQPYKSYSSGMKSRLGFAIMIHMSPDVMIVDEALAVGDGTFKRKCEERINAFKEQGKTFIMVSHSLKDIERLCEKTAWIHYGELRQFDDSTPVVIAYRKYTKWFESLDEEQKNKAVNEKREERMNFNVERYYQIAINTAFSDAHKKKLERLFLRNDTLKKMSRPVQILNIFLLLIMSLLIAREIQLVIIYWRDFHAAQL